MNEKKDFISTLDKIRDDKIQSLENELRALKREVYRIHQELLNLKMGRSRLIK